MEVRTRQDLFHIDTRVDAQHIVPASRLVSTITGFPVQPNKAIVGANAFAHESGIHQDGVLKHRETYEIMRAQDVGWHTNSLVLGKHSGRNAFRTRLLELGIQFETETELNEAFTRFKALADLKHEIFDEDLQAIASDTKQKEEIGRYGLVCMQVCSETGVVPKAKLTLTVDGDEHTVEAEGSGPVDATFKAIESWWILAVTCSCIRSTTLPAVPMPRGRSPCALSGVVESLMVWVPIPISSSPLPRPTSKP